MKFIIKGKTPSVNALYGHNKFGSVYLTNEAKILRKNILELLEEQKGQFIHKDWAGRLIDITVTIYEDWFTKKNEVKKKDIANKEKFLVDTVFEGLGLDDKHIWHHTMIKCQEDSVENYRAEIEINYWRPNGKSNNNHNTK